MTFSRCFKAQFLKCLLVVVSFAAGPLSAVAGDYPDQPIHFIVPYPAGGASDVIARLIGQGLSKSLHQPVIIENHPGANGIIALDRAAKAPHDGYTLLMTNIGPTAINPSIYSKLPYNAIKDFTPVTLTHRVPLILVANKSLGINSIADLIARSKAKPETLSYAVAGVGTAGHLAMELFKTKTGASIKMVPYKGDLPGLQDVIGGQVSLMPATALAATPMIHSGQVKALAVTTTRRLAAEPNIPTVSEAGLPGFEAVSWGGVMVPANTPRSIVNKLHDAIVQIMQSPDVKRKLMALGAEAVTDTPEQFQTYINAETVKWKEVARVGKIKL